ncbi:unnamed protein product [Periconia digitata]|uniref:Glycoside hydrolase family 71 protein n=1 Tax=Periconia digitata TaxID=1303443 RepID=A0A9W4UG94_9PLEO|nr:unnamed protein product [Periconia digitata]
MHFVTTLSVSLLAAIATARPSPRAPDQPPVFAHYMIGEIFDDHTEQDISDAKALGIDAFALNINNIKDSWSVNTVDRLFKHADAKGFGLFFSFDMAKDAGYFTAPDQFQDYLKNFLKRKSYYKYGGKNLVSTFGGEEVSATQWIKFKENVGNSIVVPGYYQSEQADGKVFEKNNGLDGIFNWNSWPEAGSKTKVSAAGDKTFKSAATNGKLFMMGMSPLQFKHMDNQENRYRRGEDNLELRIEQVLDVQPQMLELQTWNDGGEGHYMGKLWPEPMTDAAAIKKYVDGYDHTGYWQILPSFIQAYKRGDKDTKNMVPTNGKSVQGTFWHHTLTVGGNCGSDPIKKPSTASAAEDAVTGVILVAKGKSGLTVVVKNGDKELGKQGLKEGFNRFKFTGLGAGKVQVEVWEGSTMVSGGYGPKEVKTSDSVCNYNFQVVAMGA